MQLDALIANAVSQQLGHGPEWTCSTGCGGVSIAGWRARNVEVEHPRSQISTLVYHLGGSHEVVGFRGHQCLGQGVRQARITLDGHHGSRWKLSGEMSFVHLYVSQTTLDQYVRRTRSIARAPWLQPCFDRDDPWLDAFLTLLMQTRLMGREGGDCKLLEQLVDSLLEHLLCFYTQTPIRSFTTRREPRLSSRVLRNIELHIEANLHQSVTIGEIAQLSGLSEGHLQREFRQAKGRTPHQYLIDRRLERCKALLAEAELSLADIARLVGFASASHLGDTFRRRYGMTLGQYRATHAL